MLLGVGANKGLGCKVSYRALGDMKRLYVLGVAMWLISNTSTCFSKWP